MSPYMKYLPGRVTSCMGTYIVPTLPNSLKCVFVPGVRIVEKESEKKIYAVKEPAPHIVIFFCSHLFALPPRSEHLEQAISPSGKEGREPIPANSHALGVSLTPAG